MKVAIKWLDPHIMNNENLRTFYEVGGVKYDAKNRTLELKHSNGEITATILLTEGMYYTADELEEKQNYD